MGFCQARSAVVSTNDYKGLEVKPSKPFSWNIQRDIQMISGGYRRFFYVLTCQNVCF